jgi:membrane protein YqaA with SNARE-associated domain
MAHLSSLSEVRAATLTGFLWGLAEATVFFIVPDVLLCYWAMRSAKEAMAATLTVVAGAMLGAVVLYVSLDLDAERYEFFHEVWGSLPGFREKMAETAAEHLRMAGARGLLSGPTSGIPYRVYVLEAWKLKLSLGAVLLWTPFARLERIAIAPIIVLALRLLTKHLLARRFGRIPWNWVLAGLIVIYWVALYIWYWGTLVPRVYG